MLDFYCQFRSLVVSAMAKNDPFTRIRTSGYDAAGFLTKGVVFLNEY